MNKVYGELAEDNHKKIADCIRGKQSKGVEQNKIQVGQTKTKKYNLMCRIN